MTTALEGVRGQRHAPAALYLRERPGTHCTGGWKGPRAGLDRCGKSRPTGIRSPDRPARSQSLYRLSYPAHPAVSYWIVIECLYVRNIQTALLGTLCSNHVILWFHLFLISKTEVNRVYTQIILIIFKFNICGSEHHAL